jgi:outer membrane protein OmpA-like peptidoglycan-associated protein
VTGRDRWPTVLGLVVAALLLATPAAAADTTAPPDPDAGTRTVPPASEDPVEFPVQDISAEVQDLVFPQANADGTIVDEGDGDFTLASDVLFDFDESELKPDARKEIARIGGVLTVDPRATGSGTLDVVGHTDDVGDDAYNQTLSEARAEAVRAQLQTALPAGIRVRASGEGETQPVADNATDEGRAKNRRVEITVDD